MRTIVVLLALAVARAPAFAQADASADAPRTLDVRIPGTSPAMTKRITVQLGARVYVRRCIRVRVESNDATGSTLEHTRTADAASRIERVSRGLLILEPDGTRWTVPAEAVIDTGDSMPNYRIVVIPPGTKIPAYLRDVQPDAIAR